MFSLIKLCIVLFIYFIINFIRVFIHSFRGTGMMLVAVLFAPIRGGSLGICSVSCMLYGMVRKH